MVIALITDFGLQDSYVGVMKGVIAAIAPTAQCLDLTHAIPPQDLHAARFTLLSAYPYLPADTIYLVVVDPGVGTERRGVAVQTARGMLVGPDNGLFGGGWDGSPVLKAVALTNSAYWRSPQPSATFHGRDIFAPVAAHLASGVPIDRLGPAIDPQSLVRLSPEAPAASVSDREGTVQYIDRFGNAVTTIPAESLPAGPWQIRVGTITLAGVGTYGDVSAGEGLALVGSHGFVELAVNQGSAEARFGLAVGDRVSVNA
ncbi:S-adenosyl-l-methionine hydroxide adenosyltransferase family protein [Leptolyngbya sp. KIOST-1]|uniref:SAM hydrolase/SAM-dependent halogenase family protein n=1 Tax=Leptolyngbya sp. KIOST-1 TaxID=1229172 RepID=UPI0005683AE9|nr:SAM-dependent chlorinase/fluorinase [Leptolyngbya sp. KIOST-1]